MGLSNHSKVGSVYKHRRRTIRIAAGRTGAFHFWRCLMLLLGLVRLQSKLRMRLGGGNELRLWSERAMNVIE